LTFTFFENAELAGAQASPLAMSAEARKNAATDFNLNLTRTVFRVQATLIASGTLALQSKNCLSTENGKWKMENIPFV